MTQTIQATISGIDSGGYLWENVFHVTTNTVLTSEHDILDAMNTKINSVITGPYALAMSSQCKILDIASKIIGGAASYTLHKAVNIPGTRDISAYPGPVNGKIAWLPKTGSHVGHQYLAGACNGDFDTDIILPGYKTLVEAVIAAFMTLDGSDISYGWQLVIYNRKTLAAISVAAGVALLTACYLSKRARN
jgi:hypothetical protein